MPRVLVACEFSGIVRDAFAAKGWDAWSCDLEPTERPGPHRQGDVLQHLGDGWDLLIAHPPCTHLAVSGARWWGGKESLQEEAIAFAVSLWGCPIPRIAMENPIGLLSSRICPPSQIVQPWGFGHGECKATCLWLKNLPCLRPTNLVTGRADRIHRMAPGPNRAKDRSRTYPGIAAAMAEQWSNLPPYHNGEFLT
jgi:hypothetical protein